MAAQKLKDIPEVIKELRAMSAQFICPKDLYFSSMADLVEKQHRYCEMCAADDAADQPIVDDLAAIVDIYQKALFRISNGEDDPRAIAKQAIAAPLAWGRQSTVHRTSEGLGESGE